MPDTGNAEKDAEKKGFLAAGNSNMLWSLYSADPKWREKAREEILKNYESISTEATPAKQFHVEDSDEEEDQTKIRNQPLNRKRGVTVI